MKKVSVYFTDPQSEALDAMAAQAGITFAEALRRALDEWLAFKEGSPMSTSPTTTKTPTAYVKMRDEDYARTWRNAEIIEDSYNGIIEVWRGERKLAQFSAGDISSWYMEDIDEE